MKIHHVGLYVADLEAARLFFVRFLGADSGALYHNPTTDFKSYFLTFDDGARLEIMTRPRLQPGVEGALCYGYAHIAFSLGSRQRVDELTAALREAGYATLSGPRLTGDGCYESCVCGPEGHPIELTE